ncbi:MAG: tRNA uridine-5-carboxymethylaminomethyl(34) synthesis GTPase MnmE [Acidobacteriota bacterium]|nr:tRNA uridine-5-carboxymethylaminomethyl(34) synthesis GTPase MnmE [Acidobacteriota bacterium]
MARLVADPDREGDVLVAPATPPGISALAVVRLTGPAGATRRVARQIARRLPEEPRPREAALHLLVGEDGRPLDRALVLFFPAPHSATGEEVVEFLCHGSPAIVGGLLAAARAAGARPAKRGEFTRRALANGKLDLAEAEGVAALAAAENRGAARRALSLVEGDLSRRVLAAKEAILDVLAGLEAGLDFAEDVEAADLLAAGAALDAAAGEVEALAATAARGGARDRRKVVAILGRPNAGKSTLFNALVGRDRAIVTAVPGTTRDAIADTCEIGGETVTLLDTAGLRATEDEVEKIGVAVAERAGEGADLVLYAIDATRGLSEEDEDFLRRGRGEGTLLVRTKTDLVGASSLSSSPAIELSVSALIGAGLEALRAQMAERLSLVEADGELLVLERHREALASAAAFLRDAADLARRVPGEPELVAARVREALAALGAITGETATEELLDRIFAAFCVGK